MPALTLPSLAQSIAYGLATALGLVASWYLFQKLVPWLQAYRNRQQRSEMDAARKKAQQENQQANSDSDALDRREREHDAKDPR